MTTAAWLFAFGGCILIGIGGFFVFARPALLPEDLRYLERSASDLDTAVPRLTGWLRLVFTVLGGYAAATGILTVYLALNVRSGGLTAVIILAVAGASSIGVMAVVNLLLHSEFRWLLSAVAAVWIAATVVAVLS
ncbi:hypothetical protein [Mycolicibacterium pallens]|uniref:Transmembrane protein n=1 Tax=Mycolicibacterium pallens TaxID=370524 RepID=A0ABX8VIN2_9MYCO|nr:hypothetical protein [Mycolicibacterium pallens]QYL15409.1 hypothetical protein K0O64_20105 [Mycolicibacterium pallens]